MTITLTDEQLRAAARRAAESGCADVKTYVERLVVEDIAADEDYGAPADLQPRSRAELEAMIAEGLASPAREMTSADWDEKRRRLIERAQRPSEAG